MSILAKTSVRMAAVGLRSLNKAAVVVPMQQQRGIMDVKEVYYNLRGFNQFGLYEDDVIHETDVVKKALERLPPAELVRLHNVYPK